MGSDLFLFGYIKPFKPEMKVQEFDTYQAVYCGLCKQMGRIYGPLSRATLSYDMAFLSLMGLAVSEQCGSFKQQVCMAHPLKRKPCLCSCEDLSFSAHVAILMVYYKIKDNISDSGFFGKLKYYLFLPFVVPARRRAVKAVPELDKMIAKMMVDQAELEQSDNVSVDRAADPTANALGVIFKNMSTDEREQQVLYHVGYMVGRYVYLIDALDDLSDDIKSGNYNPFLKKFGNPVPSDKDKNQMRDYAVEVLNLTVSQLASSYELLALKRFKPILDNIVYLGLKNTQKLIIDKAN